MNYLYKFGHYPNNQLVNNRVRAASSRLFSRLNGLSVDNLGISDYNKRYFGGHIATEDLLHAHITKYSFILEWALSGIVKNLDEVVFMDYGGGHGMLSLLAKEVGLGTVIHTDIYPVSCEDAEKIAEKVNLRADYYVSGDIDTILEFFRDTPISCDVVANFDVIEHIYDIDDFLTKLHMLSHGPMSIFLASGANGLNPRIKRILIKQQVEAEYRERAATWGRKPNVVTNALHDVRKEIIAKYSPSLSTEVVTKLAFLTRGLMEKDIFSRIDGYLATGKFPDPPDHPTNTCDPFTGNWFEHLMNPYQLAETLNKTGLKTQLVCGYYDSPASPIRRFVKSSLNFAITVLGRYGFWFAPYYALFARK